MAKIVGLPKLSPTMEEGTLAKWAKKEGDAIGIDDLVAEIETDKATMEWRAFDKGVLLKILVPEGATLKPDEPVAIFGNAGEDISALLAQVGQGGGAVAAAPSGEAKASEAKTGDAKAEAPAADVEAKAQVAAKPQAGTAPTTAAPAKAEPDAPRAHG